MKDLLLDVPEKKTTSMGQLSLAHLSDGTVVKTGSTGSGSDTRVLMDDLIRLAVNLADRRER